jgi:CRP-like cAMP-binding protein
VGEYGLINNTVRQGTLSALEDSELYVLSKSSFETMMKEEPYLAFALSRICMVRTAFYLHQLQE